MNKSPDGVLIGASALVSSNTPFKIWYMYSPTTNLYMVISYTSPNISPDLKYVHIVQYYSIYICPMQQYTNILSNMNFRLLLSKTEIILNVFFVKDVQQ